MADIEKCIVSIRNINVKGGDLPDGFSIKLDADIDYTNVDKRTLAQRCAGGSSDRVKQQAVWRKMSTRVLTELSIGGVVKLDGATIGAQPSMNMKDTLANMNLVDFHESLHNFMSIHDIITVFANKNKLNRDAVVLQYIETVDEEYDETTE